MTQETLLLVFIAMTALAWAAIAATVVAIGWQVFKLLEEARLMLHQVHSAGEAALADVEELRSRLRAEGSKIWAIVDFAVGMAAHKWSHLRASRPKKKKVETAPEDFNT